MSERTSARYDEIADFYDSVVGDAVADPATSGLLSLVGEVRDMRLLDLACPGSHRSRTYAPWRPDGRSRHLGRAAR